MKKRNNATTFASLKRKKALLHCFTSENRRSHMYIEEMRGVNPLTSPLRGKKNKTGKKRTYPLCVSTSCNRMRKAEIGGNISNRQRPRQSQVWKGEVLLLPPIKESFATFLCTRWEKEKKTLWEMLGRNGSPILPLPDRILP